MVEVLSGKKQTLEILVDEEALLFGK